MIRVTAALGALALALVLAAGASAGAAQHQSAIPISGDEVFPAGTVCNFDEEDSFVGTVSFTAAPNGMFVQHVMVKATHTNLDTGYSLTETNVQNSLFRPDNSGQVTGIWWALRDPSGHSILQAAGRAVFDSDGNLVSWTPNTTLDKTFGQNLCPLLGGSAV